MTIMWTNICTILQTIILISADRTGQIFKKVLPKLCHCEQCVLCRLSVFCFLQGCCVSLCYCALLSLWVHWKQWLPHLSWAAPLNCQNHTTRDACLKTCLRLCFMFRLKGFASICSETAPEVKSGDLQTLGKWRQAAIMFHLSQLHNSNSTFMHLHWQSCHVYTCMKYNPAVQF